jgi:hypothetical protein
MAAFASLRERRLRRVLSAFGAARYRRLRTVQVNTGHLYFFQKCPQFVKVELFELARER